VARLEQIIADIGVEKKVFAKHCKMSPNQIYNYLNGSQEPATKFYRNLKKEYPTVNLNWLISGHGQKYIDEHNESKVLPIDPAVGMVLDVEKELGVRLNDRQRSAVVGVLRRELDRRLKVAERRYY
jgi:hypothetical protein